MLKVQDTDVINNLNGLRKLKTTAEAQNPEALKQVTTQFESLFLNMMLKSMRQAKLSDGLMNYDQSKQHLSSTLSASGHIDRVETMPKQAPPVDVEDIAADLKKTESNHNRNGGNHDLAVYERAKMGLLRRDWLGDTKLSAMSTEDGQIFTDDAPELDGNGLRQAFMLQLLPLAQKAAAELGVDPKVLIAQAALETGWGRATIKNLDGSSSYNLFNIKANGDWDGKQAKVPTLEFDGDMPTKVVAGFRAYDSYADSFDDYVKFIKEKPRYADALRQASNPEQYVRELQQAGYATDPSYVGKVMKIYNSVAFTGNAPTGALAMR